MCFIMHVVLKILLPLLGKFHTHISGFFAGNQHSSLVRVFLFLFLTSSAFSESFTEYQFEWNSSTKSFMLEGDSSPTLVLYEHCSYLIRSVGAKLSISENNSTHYEGDDIFFNEGIQGNGEYILLTPDQNSLRRLYYQNFDTTDSLIGTIEIKEFDNLGLLRMNPPESLANFGANVVLSDDLTLFASAPGFNDNEGLVIRSSYQTDGSYVKESNIVSPTGETTFWGSSLYFDNNQSQLLIGSSNAEDFRGSLYAYSLSTYQNKLLLEGQDMGDLLGWSFATYNEKLIVSALSVTDPRGGYFSIFTNAYSTPFVLHDKVQPEYPQFGNEYGYDISIFEDLIAVGAPGEDDLSRQDSGAVYLYRLEENNLESYKILSSIRNDGDRFGHSVLVDSGIMFVGAPSGDGSSTKSGLVYIFDCRDEALGIKEIFRLLPPNEGASQSFSQDISVVGDFVFVSSPGAEGVGAVYVYKKSGSQDAYTWELVNSIPLSLFSNDLSPSDKISIDVKKGVLAIGLEKESANEIEAGAVQILRNPAWNISYQLPIPPFFGFDSPSTLTIEEDSAEVAIDFNASLPIGFNSDLVWEVNSSSPLISLEDYEINSSSGAFNFYPPSNLNGTIPFTLSVHANNQKVVHDFNILINQVEDEPYFVDFNSAENHPNILPVATVGEEYNYVFQIFDADLDELTLSVVNADQLPGGLSLTGKNFVGTPLIEGNFTFQLSLTDGKSNAVVESFSLQIFPRNTAPVGFFLEDQLTNPDAINLEFSQNFSLSEWRKSIETLDIHDPNGEELSLEIVDQPVLGYLAVASSFTDFSTELIRYIPRFNSSGTDSFTLRFIDRHLGIPKFLELIFNINILSTNSAPHITSSAPQTYVQEGKWFEHTFEVKDTDEDFWEMSIQGLPEWLTFNNNKSIFGKPSRSDYSDSTKEFFVSVMDQYGSSTYKYHIEVIPNNYPPIISFDGLSASEIELNMTEDGDPFLIHLTASNPDGNETDLIWKISLDTTDGNVEILSQNSSAANISFLPDGNFSGATTFAIQVFEEKDRESVDEISIFFNVQPTPDSPRFESKPFPGIVRNRSWIYDIHGIDGDLNDFLTLSSLVNLPEWLRLSQTGSRTWTLTGFPTDSDEEVPVHLRLSDGNTSVDQNFTLRVIGSIDDLQIIESNGTEFSHNTETPTTHYVSISLEEDSNWTLGALKVNAIEDIRIRWSVLQYPESGEIEFFEGLNGEIRNLSYVPDQNFFGTDFFSLKVTDNYSSLVFNFYFDVISQEDPFVFTEYPTGIIQNDEEIYDFLITFEDGDGIKNLGGIKSMIIPDWLTYEDVHSSPFAKSLRFFGEPQVNDVGLHEISLLVKDNLQIDHAHNFKINVRFLNKPPVPSPSAISTTFDEDSFNENSPKIWKNIFSVTDVESSVDEMSWSIVSRPLHGTAWIDERAERLIYFPDANYSGKDSFTVGVYDNGGDFNTSPRQTIVPVNITINSINDLPVFRSSPPSDSDEGSDITWNDEKPFSYEVIVDDSDWVWQGYPQLKLVSTLPNWLTWKNLGNGRALLSGSPQWYHQGSYSFSIEAKSGYDKIYQNFDLTIIVDDYPPRIQDSDGEDINKKIQFFIIEDGSTEIIENFVYGISAFNPDKEIGESLRWLAFEQPSSGGSISLTSLSDHENENALITNFEYQLPANFNGLDRFTLIADEGDRFTEIAFEVNVKSIPDPPRFTSQSPAVLSVIPEKYVSFTFEVDEPDNQSVDFKVLYLSNDLKWFSIISEVNTGSDLSVTIGGVVPKNFQSQSFSLVVSDTTGRFATLPVELHSE
jgi:hypothetical protein